MSFYDVLATNYSEIFPIDENRIKFITSYATKSGESIMDVGCATGDLAIELAKKQFSVTAIDLNRKMISIAKNKAALFKLAIDFQTEDMLHIKKLGSEQFPLILCFGNTLPHLKSSKEIESFFKISHLILSLQGKLLIQILNYDKILAEKKVHFPVISTHNVVLTREYKKIERQRIDFFIRLKEKHPKKEFLESIVLFPITKNRIEALVYKSGFSEVECFSDYNFSQSNLTEYSTIYVVTK